MGELKPEVLGDSHVAAVQAHLAEHRGHVSVANASTDDLDELMSRQAMLARQSMLPKGGPAQVSIHAAAVMPSLPVRTSRSSKGHIQIWLLQCGMACQC